MSTDYAVYRGEEILFVGSMEEIMNKFELKKNNFNKIASPGYVAKNADKNRRIIIALEDDEQEEYRCEIKVERRRIDGWTESEDALLNNCKTYNDAAKVGKVLGKSTAAVWARVRRLNKKKG